MGMSHVSVVHSHFQQEYVYNIKSIYHSKLKEQEVIHSLLWQTDHSCLIENIFVWY